ncbi:hypothetical protein [Desulfovibrio sp.]|uniref:beta strand repeat-containing protein n=1 Tax=Desulfovibrio sp. TaxID=885 RepID=UPI0025C60BE3|nr:hypothetical protein [Desulfovibrio sp.]
MPTITISRPLQGQAITVSAAGKNAKIALGFSTDGATLSRDDNSLIFTFEDGAVIRIDDFYTAYHSDNIPEFEIEGKLVSGTEFFNALGPNLIPAAGPATAIRTARSSDHTTSDLASGVDHLDGTDIKIEGSGFQPGSLLFDSPAVLLADTAGPDAPVEGPSFPAGPFVRAVLYSPGATGDAVTTSVFFGGNGAAPVAIAPGGIDFDGTNATAPYAVSVSLPAGWSSSWVDVSFNNLTGRLEFRLTADGVTEMQRLGLTGESLVDFIHITVTDRASGENYEYNVELVVTDNQNFDSAEHDSRYGGQHLDNIGEFHQGQNNGGVYSVISSAQNDEIIINDAVSGGSSIHASGSAGPAHMADDYNTINLNAGVTNTTPGSTTQITSADGELNVAYGVTGQGNAAANVIDMGNGTVHVQNASGNGMSASDSGSNSITTDGGDVSVSGGGSGSGMDVWSSGSNKIETKDGNVSVSGGYFGMRTDDAGSSNTITTASGDVAVSNNQRSMSASDSGSNSISTESGNVTVNGSFTGPGSASQDTPVTSSGMSATFSGNNNIQTTDGDVTVSGSYTGAGNPSGSARWGVGYGMHADDSGSNNIATENGNVAVVGSRDGQGAGLGSGMVASGGSNRITTKDGDVAVSGTGSNSGTGYGMSASSAGSNSISTEGGSVNASGNTGMLGIGSLSSNSIATESGDVTVVGSGIANGHGTGMEAEQSGSNSITTGSGKVHVSGSGIFSASAIFASHSGASNNITTDSGDVSVSAVNSNGSSYGMRAANSASNTITTKDGNASIASTRWGIYAEKSGSNSIETEDGHVSVVGSGGGGSGMWSYADGSNTITTKGGNVDVSGGSKANNLNSSSAMYAQSSGAKDPSSNIITTESGNVTLTGNSTSSSGSAMHAHASSNTVVTESGDVAASGNSISNSGYGMRSSSSGSNTITTDSGSVAIAGSSVNHSAYGMHADFSGKNQIVTESGDVTVTAKTESTGHAYGMNAASSGSNTITTDSGTITVAANNETAHSYSMNAASSGSNSIITGNGDVKVSGNSSFNLGYGMFANSAGSNSVVTASGEVTVTGAGLSGYGMHTTASGSSNSITTDDGQVNVSGSAVKGNGSGMTATIFGSNAITTASGDVNVSGNSTSGNAYGLSAASSGSNTITTESGNVVVSGNGAVGGYGVVAKGGMNTIESTPDSPLTVTITASANTAGKAIAMWADGGGSVNYITGHSQAGGTGDSITLTANNGRGIAMQAENGGKNIITTGAGNDSVTINGAVKGSGNEINLGGGDNTLTINGVVQSGSLNVIAAGGTYTLILQASDAESFATRYGGWLNAIGSDPLIAGGMTGINFEGLDFSALPAGFLSTFNDFLWALHDGGTSIEPPELVTQLHDPAAPSASPLAAMLADTGAEHMQDAQHAAGHDATQDSTLTAHDGPTLLPDDSLNAAFNAQTGNAGAQAEAFESDATAQTSFAMMDEEEEGQVQPLFTFLDDHAADMPADMPFEEGDDALHNGYLGNEGGNSADFAGLHTPITLTYGDESLDNLFAVAAEQGTERSETDLAGGALHDMGLTDMNAALDQNPLAGPDIHDGPVAVEGVAAETSEAGNVSSVMDSCQEVTDNAAREMSNY